ncbi:hypothetical protein JRQ81_011578 [Phrynocephalus forsythii]|uniref:Lens fiber membrane intrinsic protein n=1 Tax=Phrynocephalus forsythii TaxID=171643 RepID=A0A9Q0X839_9SAUR|nr:hypothetical protein JRQ81_011578 [Phrynocephalus forsythii]
MLRYGKRTCCYHVARQRFDVRTLSARVKMEISLSACIQERMYSFMGGGLFCASVANVLLAVSTVTDYWMQCRLTGAVTHQGLWRYCFPGRCYMQMERLALLPPAYRNAIRAFMILSALSCFAGIITGILSFAQFSTFKRFNRSFAASMLFFVSTLFILLALGIYTGITVNFLDKRFGEWRFSWSYILGWVALLMTFFAGPHDPTLMFMNFPLDLLGTLIHNCSFPTDDVP